MSPRTLLISGIVAIGASLVIGAVAISVGAAATSIPFAGWSSKTISIDQAQASVQSFLDRTGNGDLKVDELMEFRQNFYALIKEHSTGIGAFELLVNKSNGAVSFEPGPNMMWNTKYATMMARRMMGGAYAPVSRSAAMTVGGDQATQIAQGWLDHQFAGDSAGAPDGFYGYYTFHFQMDGRIAGMLSVNGNTGQLWFHSWHGAFIEVRDFGG